jgi:hypothetical protein
MIIKEECQKLALLFIFDSGKTIFVISVLDGFGS